FDVLVDGLDTPEASARKHGGFKPGALCGLAGRGRRDRHGRFGVRCERRNGEGGGKSCGKGCSKQKSRAFHHGSPRSHFAFIYGRNQPAASHKVTRLRDTRVVKEGLDSRSLLRRSEAASASR